MLLLSPSVCSQDRVSGETNVWGVFHSPVALEAGMRQQMMAHGWRFIPLVVWGCRGTASPWAAAHPP